MKHADSRFNCALAAFLLLAIPTRKMCCRQKRSASWPGTFQFLATGTSMRQIADHERVGTFADVQSSWYIVLSRWFSTTDEAA
jgi:hypothetical protein